MSGIDSSLSGTPSFVGRVRRVSPDAIGCIPFRDTDNVAATAEIGEAIQRGMVARRILDGIVRNVYKSNTGKTAAWSSASHVEKAPKKKDSPTP